MNEEERLARKVAEAVKASGGRVFYVGGYVRDKLLGIENKDIDIEVHGISPETLEEILDGIGERLSFGKSFGVYSLKGSSIDIAMPRKEECIGNRHTDFKVDIDPFCGTENAARRRDFTVNAMMEDVLTGEIVDHFGGKNDLRDKLIRHVNDDAFAEDPLRVLRGAQFASRFEFKIADETKELCSDMDISTISCERVFDELKKALLKAEKPSIFFEILSEIGQMSVWFPEVEALFGVEQNPKYHGEGDVFRHTMMVLDEAAKRRDKTENPLAFMLSALVHDFGKPITTEISDGKIRSYNHEIKGLPIVEEFVTRLTHDKKLLKYVLNMTKTHMRPNALAAMSSSVKATNKLFDESVEPEAIIELALADDLGRITEVPTESTEPFLRERLVEYRECMSKPFVRGEDLISAGLRPDTSFSDLLAYAHKLRLAGVEKDEALRQTIAYSRKK